MNNLKKLLAGIAGLLVTAVSFAQDDTANGTLEVTLGAGNLSIVGGVTGSHAPSGGPHITTGTIQADAVQFEINGIEIDDFDGNGNGFFVTVIPPSSLDNALATTSLNIGTTAGAHNIGDGNGGADTTISTVTTNNDTATYNVGSGIDGFTLDYDVAYTIPALAPADTYTGTLTVEVTTL